MVSVKESVEQIKDQFLDVFGSDLTDIRLEEINASKNGKYYLTVSFLVPNKNISEAAVSKFGAGIFPCIREYKNVVVDKQNGNIISIKMRKDA